MGLVKEKYVVDKKGKRIGIVLDPKEYQKILKKLEELESIRAYDVAKASGNRRLPFNQAVQEIEKVRKRQGRQRP